MFSARAEGVDRYGMSVLVEIGTNLPSVSGSVTFELH